MCAVPGAGAAEARDRTQATVVPRKTLRDLRQAAARAVAMGGIRINTAEADTLASMLDDLFRLHEARWRSRGECGVLADPAVREFHRDAAPALAAEGMLRLYGCTSVRRSRRCITGLPWRGRSYAYLGGFDPEMPPLRPRRAGAAWGLRDGDRRGLRRVRFPARRRGLQIRLGCRRSLERVADVAARGQLRQAMPASRPFAAYRRGDISAEIAGDARSCWRSGMRARRSDGSTAAEEPELLRVARACRYGLGRVTSLVRAGLTGERSGGIDAIRAQFDEAVALAPKGPRWRFTRSALPDIFYQHGDGRNPQSVGGVGAGSARAIDVLDVGCGIGRIERALAPELRSITGIDLSPGMRSPRRGRVAATSAMSRFLCVDGSDLVGS